MSRAGWTRELPFPELQRRAHVNARAQAADQAADFSRRIRDTSAMQSSIAPSRAADDAMRHARWWARSSTAAAAADTP